MYQLTYKSRTTTHAQLNNSSEGTAARGRETRLSMQSEQLLEGEEGENERRVPIREWNEIFKWTLLGEGKTSLRVFWNYPVPEKVSRLDCFGLDKQRVPSDVWGCYQGSESCWLSIAERRSHYAWCCTSSKINYCTEQLTDLDFYAFSISQPERILTIAPL